MNTKKRSEGDPPVKSVKSVFKLTKMIYESTPLLFCGQVILTILISLLPVATAYIWQQILEGATTSDAQIIFLFLSLAVAGGLSISSGYFREVVDTVFRNSISVNMQKRVHKKASEIPTDDYETPSLEDLLARASDSLFYGNAVGFIVVGFYAVQVFLSIIMTGVLVWGYHPLLTLLLLLLFLLRIIGIQLNKKKLALELELAPIRRKCEVYKKYLTKYENIKEIRVLDAHAVFFDKWHQAMDSAVKREEELSGKFMRYQLGMDFFERLTTISAYLLCVFLVTRGEVNLAQFGALIVLLQQFLQNSAELLERIRDLHSCSIHVQSSLEYLDLPVECRDIPLEEPVNTITLENVSYKYPEMERNAVSDISLTLRKNEVIAVVGKNGSGKTTLSKLISGLINPGTGQVKFNNVPTNRIDFTSLYRHTTAVLQDFTKYYMTVRDNIILSDTGRHVTDMELSELLGEMDITFLSGGSETDLDTPLGIEYGGKELSGGQWQQLAIARARFKKAKLIILDEPTSALDPLKEAQLYETFKEMCKGKIGIIITHRLSLCALANRILVMENGHIVEDGTHGQLMKNDGGYAQIFKKQADMYKGLAHNSC